MGNDLRSTVRKACLSICNFTEIASGLKLRAYQQSPALAIVDSVLNHKGLSFVIKFPRQSGKNELQAQIEVYLLTLFKETNAEIIKISPTWKPQSMNAMRRLERILSKNLITRIMWNKEAGYIYKIGTAMISFLSGSPEASIVGATASHLLEVDEAQDVLISKFDKDIAPMAASTNATRVFWGTAWTSRTLLYREEQAALLAQKQDGIQRVFSLTAEGVAKEVPAYGKFVAEQIAKLGRNNPMVRTQFFSETIDAEGGMFPLTRLVMIAGKHRRQVKPSPASLYAFLIDVAGEDESQSGKLEDLENQKRDSTSLTIVEIDLSTIEDEFIKKPSYHVVERRSWIGKKHVSLYGELKALANLWLPRYLVVDATGVGAGLASFLDNALPGQVVRYIFTGTSKSTLGWNFLSLIDTGRFKDYDPSDPVFIQQLSACQYEIFPGPEKRMKWGVPDGTRDPATGELVHDDDVLSAALCSVLDNLDWSVSGSSLVIQAVDPLTELDRGF